MLGGGFGGLYTAVKLESLMWPKGNKPKVGGCGRLLAQAKGMAGVVLSRQSSLQAQPGPCRECYNAGLGFCLVS